jgi:hypothetical protein
VPACRAARYAVTGCLQLATNIRVVLAELAERLGTALKEEKELTAAISRLAQRPKKP